MRRKSGLCRGGLYFAILFFFLACGIPSAWGQGQQLAATPPMGWSSWNHFGCHISEAIMREQAHAMATNGMKAAGYRYVNLDDCWAGKRGPDGKIEPNSRFPNMKALGTYIHSLGLKFGIYSSPGPKTCAGYPGSYRHVKQDAETYASWGVDYLKYDWCSAAQVYKTSQMPAVYKKMHEALVATGRPIVFSLCQYGMDRVWRWGASVGGNLWRTTDDVQPNYTRIAFIGFGQEGLAKYAGPGHWNDPDMLEIGNGHLNLNEQKTQMSLWCILAAPLIAGNDLTKMSPQTLDILTNPEVIAVDQDPAGIEGHRVSEVGPLEVWVKPLADGSKAVGLFNKGMSTMPITVYFKEIGFNGPVSLRDLWAKKNLGTFKNSYTAQVPRHGVVMLRVKASS